MNPLSLWLNLATISAAWGSSFLFVKLLSPTLPPFALASGRGLFAMAALLVWLAFRRLRQGTKSGTSSSLSWRNLRHMVVLGTTNGWLASALTVVAVRHLDTSIVAMIQAVVPLIVLVLAHFLFAEERFRIGQFAGILMGLLGILLIIGPLAVFGGRGSLIGIGAMLLTAFCFACGTVYGRHISGTDTTILACGQQACGAVIAAVISVLIESSSIGLQPARVWVLLAVVGILCSALPTVLYLRLLTKAASVPAALVAYLQPVWAMLLGCAVLGESISAAALFGAGLVISGIFTTTIANKTESPAFWRRITWLINAINRLPISRGPAADQETARLGPGRLGASESPAARSVSEAALTS